MPTWASCVGWNPALHCPAMGLLPALCKGRLSRRDKKRQGKKMHFFAVNTACSHRFLSALDGNYFCVISSHPMTLPFSLQRFCCQVLIPLLATQLHIHLGGLMTYTVPSLHDFSRRVIRGEWQLQRYGYHWGRGQSQSVSDFTMGCFSEWNHVGGCIWGGKEVGKEKPKKRERIRVSCWAFRELGCEKERVSKYFFVGVWDWAECQRGACWHTDWEGTERWKALFQSAGDP